MLRQMFVPVLLGAAFLAPCPPVFAADSEPVPAAAPETFQDRETRLKYDAVWPDFVGVIAPCLDDYLIVPRYDGGCDSSRGQPRGEVRKKLAFNFKYKWGKTMNQLRVEPSEDDMRAFDCLPGVIPGEYGWLRSAKIVKVLNATEMEVCNLRYCADSKTVGVEKLKWVSDKKAVIEAARKARDKEIDKQISEKKNEASAAKASATRWRKLKNRAKAQECDAECAQCGRDIKSLAAEKKDLDAEARDDEAQLRKDAPKAFRARMVALDRQKTDQRKLSGTFHLVGFLSSGLSPGAVWTGPSGTGFRVAVGWKAKDGQTVLGALSLLEHPVQKSDMAILLTKRGVKQADLVAQVADAKKGLASGDKWGVVAHAMAARWMRDQPREKADYSDPPEAEGPVPAKPATKPKK